MSRHGCHLCEEMAADLAQLQVGHFQPAGIRWRMEDVDARSDWRRRWGGEVPVLLLERPDGDWQELCRHRLQPSALLAVLAADDPAAAG